MVVHYKPYQTPNNIITYRASEKLAETISNKNSGLHTNAFNTAIISHTFEDGVGTVEFDGDVTTIGNYGFYGCRGLTEITIPNSVTSIGNSAFVSCSGLTSVNIPSGVTYIGIAAFNSCSGLIEITIPNSVTSISQNAFQDCRSLTSVTIPSGVTSIDIWAFYNCSGLTSVTIKATTPPTLGNIDAFNNTNNCPIYVPSESVEAYKTANNWSTYASRIQAIPTT